MVFSPASNKYGEQRYIARENQCGPINSSPRQRHGISLSRERHPLREFWRPGPAAVCCISSLASCSRVCGRAGTVCWRSGCAEWRSVSTRSGVYCRCHAWSNLSSPPSQWIRYWQGRGGICTHTVAIGISIPLSRAGLVLAGVLASGIAAEILNPAFDSDHRRITPTPHEGIVFQGMQE
jgi:hypothetical protein